MGRGRSWLISCLWTAKNVTGAQNRAQKGPTAALRISQAARSSAPVTQMNLATPAHTRGPSSGIQKVGPNHSTAVRANRFLIRYTIHMAVSGVQACRLKRLVALLLCVGADSNHSHPGGSDQQQDHKRLDVKHCDSRDSGMAAAQDDPQEHALVHEPDPMQLLQQYSQPIQAAATYAAHKAKQQAVQQQRHVQGGLLMPSAASSCCSTAGLPIQSGLYAIVYGILKQC